MDDPENASEIPVNTEYNKIFEELVTHYDDELEGMVAYGIYKKSKVEWSEDFWRKNHRVPTRDEINAYHSTWTRYTVKNARSRAVEILSEYAAEAIAAARADIREEALKGSFIKSVWISIVGAFAYTVILIAVIVVLALVGVDILGLAQK